MSQALRKLTGTIAKTGCCCIFINQLREKIGIMFGNPETTTGGNALKFYASVRLDIRRISQIKETDEVTGNRVKVKIVKNKVAPPFRIAEFDIMFGEGISKAGEVVDLGVEFEIIKKAGSWFSYGDTKLGQGRDAVKALIQDNPDLAEELETKIKDFIKDFEIDRKTIHIHNDVSVVKGITNFAQEIDADLIALTTHGRSGLSSLFNSSIAKSVSKSVLRPVITFKI